MKTPTTIVTSPNRRAFLKGLGILGAGSVLHSQSAFAGPSRYAHRFQLFAEATVTDFSLIFPVPQFPPLPPGVVLRVRLRFPIDGRDILEWETFIAPENSPNQSLAVVTLFHMRVDKIALSKIPTPNFGLFGQVIDNPVVDNPNHSPWGDLTGHVLAVGGQFDAPGDATTFSLLGGVAMGNHGSALRSATGSLRVQGPWNSF